MCFASNSCIYINNSFVTFMSKKGDLDVSHSAERPTPVEGLPSLDLEGIASYIRNGYAKKVVMLTGAGLSVAAGIHDFRSPQTGLYSNLHKYRLPRPESVFEREYFQKNPKPFFAVSKSLLPGPFKPTPAHYLSVLLQQKGILYKYYTQNIDDLDRRAGLQYPTLVECHGTYRTSTCQNCGKHYETEEIKPTILNDEIPHCQCGGIIVPDVVMYGDDLPEEFFDTLTDDFENCDLLIVIGTSLKVEPFPSVIEDVPRDKPRVLINNEPVVTYKERLVERNGKIVDTSKDRLSAKFKFGHFFNRRDVFLGGDIQNNVKALVKAIGWEKEFNQLISTNKFNQ